jgi:hypothetical protein
VFPHYYKKIVITASSKQPSPPVLKLVAVMRETGGDDIFVNRW